MTIWLNQQTDVFRISNTTKGIDIDYDRIIKKVSIFVLNSCSECQILLAGLGIIYGR